MGKKGRKKSRVSSIVVTNKDTCTATTAIAPHVCPHILKGVNLNTFSANIASFPSSITCQDCSKRKGKGKCKDANKNIWVCLNCAHFTCGGLGLPTTPHCHVLTHSTQTRHPLFTLFDKPQFCWCFRCNMPIQHTDQTSHLLSHALNLFKQHSSLKSPPNPHISPTSDIQSKTLITTASSYGRGGYVVRGMLNLGNTCFFNSIMQILLAMDNLRHNFLNLEAPSPQFRGYQQHDSHEFLRCLLDGLSTEELAARKHNVTNSNNTLVHALFGGQISSTVCCTHCGHFSTVYEPFLDLSLPVPTKKPPPSKAQQVSRTKNTKLPPKKGGKSRAKGRKDVGPLPTQSLSNQLSGPAPSNTSSVVAEMLDSSGDSTVQGSEEISNTADKYDLSSPKFVAVAESQNTQQVIDNAIKNMLASWDDFTWLDFVEDGNVAGESDFISQEDTLEVHDAENNNECLKELHVQVATCESHGPVNFLKDNEEDQNPRPDSSLENGWKDEVPLQVQGSEVLLLPYKEESPSAGEIIGKDGEASSSVLDRGQEELEFDGHGDLFDEPEVVVAGPAPRPTLSGEVVGTGFIVGNNNESEPDEVDDTDSLVSVGSCLAHFIEPELLSDDNAWYCDNCSKLIQCQKMKTNKLVKNVSNGNETSGHKEPGHAACSVKVGGLGNVDIGNGENVGSSVSHVKNGMELERGQIHELSTNTNDRDHGALEMKDKHNEELEYSGSHKASNKESCNRQAADSSSTLHMSDTVQKSDTWMLGEYNKDSNEHNEEEANSKSVKVKRDATKRVLIYKAPPVLTIHLKRFSQDACGHLSKLNGHVSFREIMDLRPYMDPRCVNEENYEYHLVGVVEHVGSMRGGHYVAYARGMADKGNENEGSTWYHASDSDVREASLNEVLHLEIELYRIREERKSELSHCKTSSSYNNKQQQHQQHQHQQQHQRSRTQQPPHLDHEVDMDDLLSSISETQNEQQLFALLSRYSGRQLSIRFMVSLLSRQSDWQRSLAILDWINHKARYSPSLFAFNVVIRNVLRAKQWQLAHGLFDEMRQLGLSPDRYTYSTLITYFGKHGLFDSSLFWLQQMEQDNVPGDLVLYSNLIELSRKLCDYSKAISIFMRLKSSGITPDLVAYNSMINVFGKAKLFREARLLLHEMRENGVQPDTVSYSTLLTMYVENHKFVEALSMFSEMNEGKCSPDLTTCNIMIDVYGQLDMAKEADRLFWSMRKIGIEPSVVSYNTLLRVYGEAELFGEAIQLFRLMQKKSIQQNVVTYNTMIKIYGKSLEHEKATNLIQEMQNRGIEPNSITYSTIISIWEKAGKLDRAAMLFQKLRSSGAEIDQVLYQTMIVAYERAGLVGHAKRLLQELKQPDSIPRETAITILARAGRIEEATWVFRQAFDAGEIKDISVFSCMIDLFSRNKKYANVVEVFEKMREVGYFPDSNVIALVLNAFGKLREFEKADALYGQMYEEGCVFPDEVHFQMLSLYGAKKDFKMVESLFEKLDSNPNINKKELHLVVASIYERVDRLNDSSRIMNRMNQRATGNHDRA
ncbi:hypothetical protein TanjilG_33035 [Lupinus angustifolius]|uniref:Uncharacterized protein n=1 Tax=Lupinus angustifolius TaxID=3871 RepID=A0A4P1RNJ8_LUPAN|nr:hypothetical protein TanjilG_33035 [Lupinus angustifolius]